METTERVKELVGHRIKFLRESAGKKQDQVAEAANFERSNYQRYEHGLQNATLDSLVRIANAIGCKVGDFFVEEPGDAIPTTNRIEQ